MRERGRRTGATMVMVALLTTVMIGMAAMAIDISRLYVMRTQLNTVTDAAALAGAVEVSKGRPALATDTALRYTTRNLVEGHGATLLPGAVEVGVWNFPWGPFAPLPQSSWTTTPPNAVRVTASYTGNYTFGRIFGLTRGTLRTQSVAAVGYVNETTCLKPWAVSYQLLLDALFPPAGSKKADSYNLQPEDIRPLMVDILRGNQAPFAPGSIGQLRLGGPGLYQGNILGCSNVAVGPGTWLDTETGVGSGQTHDALWEFCDQHGGATGKKNGNADFTCLGAPKVKIVLWDVTNNLTGANLKYHVKYVGVLAVTGYSKKDPYITGYFSGLASDGAFTTIPSPLTKIALVQ